MPRAQRRFPVSDDQEHSYVRRSGVLRSCKWLVTHRRHRHTRHGQRLMTARPCCCRRSLLSTRHGKFFNDDQTTCDSSFPSTSRLAGSLIHV